MAKKKTLAQPVIARSEATRQFRHRSLFLLRKYLINYSIPVLMLSAFTFFALFNKKTNGITANVTIIINL